MYTFHNGWTKEKLDKFCFDFARRQTARLEVDDNGHKRTDREGNTYEIRYKYYDGGFTLEDCTITINGQLVRTGLDY